MKNQSRTAFVFIALATVACAISLPGPSKPSEEATSSSPIQTPSSSELPWLNDGGVSASLLEDVDLVQLYTTANPGIVTIWTFVDLGPPHSSITPSGQGSGFVIDLDGHIVTNQHVIADAEQIEVDFPSGYRAWASVVGTDPDSDLALLKVDIPVEALHPLPLGDSDLVQVGEFVVAIGNPFGLSGTMTVGIVSAVGRTLESERQAPTGGLFTAGAIIQTDAAINPGNSGGPLLNLRGEVVGVNAQIVTGGAPVNTGVGFAIPANTVRRVAPVLIESGSYQWPWLGIEGGSVNLAIMDANDLDTQQGAYIHGVVPDGPADKAGLRGSTSEADTEGLKVPLGGDVVIEADGKRVFDFSDLLVDIASKNPGDEMNLTIIRDGRRRQVSVTLAPRPSGSEGQDTRSE